MVDYSKAIWSPTSNFFPNTGKKSFIICHGTAGGSSAENIAAYFKNTQGSDNPVSSHYIVDKAGVVIQCIAEKDGSFANGVVNNDNWLGNPNYYTISIEHVKSTTDNSEPLTPAQQAASFALIKDICKRNSIPMREADDNGGITSHASIDPINRSRCPGNFDWNALWAYLNGGNKPMPATTPTANQQKAADIEWDAILANQTLGITPKGTGIYKAWLLALINGKFYGPTITHEVDSVNWDGKAIKVQWFAYARCEWVDGMPNWYNASGKV